MKYFITIFASGLGTGFLPWVPGTWGSLVGIPLAYV
ncbi:MAG: phosphatidylglycerophosphatase A, partial [Deltaproteobacteria bacterium]|nr:phosphatidylglycerophosphatase A [Deltaproteobacteria bacterium]